MILLDSDILLIDRRYRNDPRYTLNQQVIQQLRAGTVPVGITLQAMLEVFGALSFSLSQGKMAILVNELIVDYRLVILPDPHQHVDYAACTVNEVLGQMSLKMSLGDAVQAVQIARYASSAAALLTWNARHFIGKMAVPVLTPQEWLNQQAGTTP